MGYKRTLDDRAKIVSLVALVLSACSLIIPKYSSLFTENTAMSITLGLIASGLSTFIVSEMVRERRNEVLTSEVLARLCSIEDCYTPFKIVTSKERYELGTKIATEAKERIVLFAGSLILLTGARPYLGTQKFEHEKAQETAFAELMQLAAKGNKPVFRVAFKEENLLAEIKNVTDKSQNNLFRDNVNNNLKTVLELKKSTQSNFEIKKVIDGNSELHYIFIVGDNTFAIWLKNAATKGQDICLSGCSKDICDHLIFLFDERTTEINETSLRAIQRGQPLT